MPRCRAALPAIGLAISLLLLTGCRFFQNTEPEIRNLGWATANIAPSFWAEGDPDAPTAVYYFEVDVADPDGIEDIERITVSSPGEARVWTLLDRSSGIDYLSQNGEYWGGWGFYDPDDRDAVTLGQYTVTIEDSRRHQIEAGFEVTLPGRLTAGGYEHICTEDHWAWPGSSGYECMLRRADVTLAEVGGDGLRINFHAFSPAHDGAVWFYDADRTYLGEIGNLDALADGGLQASEDGALNSVTITEDDLSREGISASVVDGIHVVLFDGAQYGGSSFDHESISEYEELTIQVVTYTVTYDGNGNDGGTVPVDTNEYAAGWSVWTKTNSGGLTRAGTVFDGWNTLPDGTGTHYGENQWFSMPPADLTLYAEWAPTFNVDYDANGATSGTVPTDSNDYPEGATVWVQGNTGGLTNGILGFDGWNTSAGGDQLHYDPGNSFTMPAQDVTLYAEWATTYTVLYDDNGATGGTVPVDSTRYLPGDIIVLPGNVGDLTKTDYGFTGWNTEADGNGTSRSPGQTYEMPEGGITFYVEWEPAHNVIYDGNGESAGDPPTDPAGYLPGDPVTVQGNPGDLARGGYAFMGWNTQPDGLGTRYLEGEEFDMGATDFTLYADWEFGIASVCAGTHHTAILDIDGNLLMTGANGSGQFGDGTTTPQTSPVYIMSGVREVSVGLLHTMILKDDDTLWACGWNGFNQLGDGSGVDQHSPVQVLTDVATVDCGSRYTYAVRNNGTLWVTGDTATRTTFEQVMTGVADVSAGTVHDLVLKPDNTLWAKGSNDNGELGDGTNEYRSTFVHIMDGVSAMWAGGRHTLIIKDDGTLWATGDNYYGQLGDGTTDDRNEPYQLASSVEVAVGGSWHTVYVTSAGHLMGTGKDDNGQLGPDNGAVWPFTSPVWVTSSVESASAGGEYTMILKTDGTLWGTGENSEGQLGDGSATDRFGPVETRF